jgi:hypothetical protein
VENGASIIQGAGMAVKKIPVHTPRVFEATPGAVSGSVKLVAASAARRCRTSGSTASTARPG